MQRKGVCMNHLADVRSFFKDANIVLSARNEEDVEPSTLMQHVSKFASRIKVDKSNGTVVSNDSSKPVGSNYKRIIPQNEISKKEREQFWQKEKQEEESRLKEKKAKELAPKIDLDSIKRNESTSDEQNSVDRRNSSESLRKERLNEAKAVISKNNITNARAFFEQNSSSSQLNNNNNSITNHGSSKPIGKLNISDDFVKREQNGHSHPVDTSTTPASTNHDDSHVEEIDDIAEKVVEEANQYENEKQNDSEEAVDEFYTNLTYSSQYNAYFPESRSLENIEEESKC